MHHVVFSNGINQAATVSAFFHKIKSTVNFGAKKVEKGQNKAVNVISSVTVPSKNQEDADGPDPKQGKRELCQATMATRFCKVPKTLLPGQG
jgi:hypothetical protein